MKAYKVMIITGIFAMILTLASPVLAGHGRYGKGCPPGEKISAILKDFDLSETQKTKVDAIVERHRSERKTLYKSLGEKREVLFDAMHAPKFKEDAVRKAFKMVSSIKEKLVISRAKMFAELRGVLDPEQMGYLRGRIETMKGFRGPGRSPVNHLN